MARMSIEQRLADKFCEVSVRMDFDADKFGWYLSQCGWFVQKQMFRMLVSLVAHWSIDWDNKHDKGSDEYRTLTMYATILQKHIDENSMQDL